MKGVNQTPELETSESGGTLKRKLADIKAALRMGRSAPLATPRKASPSNGFKDPNRRQRSEKLHQF
jgi:hypothetical protein